MNHYEIARTDADQPWHVRIIVNGKKILVSENLTRQVGAERAILSTARFHGLPVAELRWNVPGAEKIMVNKLGAVIDGAPTIRYIDEREPLR